MEQDYKKQQDAIDESDRINATLDQNQGSVKIPDPEDVEKVDREKPSNNELNDMEQGREFVGFTPQ